MGFVDDSVFDSSIAPVAVAVETTVEGMTGSMAIAFP